MCNFPRTDALRTFRTCLCGKTAFMRGRMTSRRPLPPDALALFFEPPDYFRRLEKAVRQMAERKRRTEMKELFDQLRDLMPQERGSKASKWEILTKGRFRTRFTSGLA